MSEKSKKKPTTSKGKGNKETRQRRESKEYAEQKNEGKTPIKRSERNKPKSQTKKVEVAEGPIEAREIVEPLVENKEIIEEQEKIEENRIKIKINDFEEEISEENTGQNHVTEVHEDEKNRAEVEFTVESETTEQTEIVIEEISEVEEAQIELQTLENDLLEETTETIIEQPTRVETPRERIMQPSSTRDRFLDQIAVEPIEEDQPVTKIGKFYKSKVARYGNPIDLKKYLLPNEQHLNGKMVIYFGEGQIFLGLFIILFAFISYFWLSIFGLSLFLGIGGLTLMTTGYASEELHITNYRIIVRRMNWVDRLFRIPRDSQYILDEIVAFDVQRAPPNKALVISAILPLLLFILQSVRSSIIATYVILVISAIFLILSQRLGKRTISFLMSGGHQVHIGQYKGIPEEIVESFTSIVMEKNVFESDQF